MKKLAANFRHTHVRMNAMGVALVILTIVQLAMAISIDWPPSHEARPIQRSCR